MKMNPHKNKCPKLGKKCWLYAKLKYLAIFGGHLYTV